MEVSDGDSDSDTDAMFSHPHSGVSGVVNILKPKIDKIFSDVQKNLPSIDFDCSDMPSENDEPIFFHHNLKFRELSASFDEEKDTDTSLCMGDAHEAADKMAEDENLYDNDLAALKTSISFPSDAEIQDWRKMSNYFLEFERRSELKETDDMLRTDLRKNISTKTQRKNSEYLGESEKTNSLDMFQSTCISDHNTCSFGNDFNLNRNEELSTQELSCESMDSESACCVNREFDENGSATSRQTVSRFRSRLASGLTGLEKAAQKKDLKEAAKKKDEEMVSKFASVEPTTLSLSLFEDLDLDSILKVVYEDNSALSDLRIVGHVTPSPNKRHAHLGSGDTVDEKEEPTLLEKLSQLSAAQSGMKNKHKPTPPQAQSQLLHQDVQDTNDGTPSQDGVACGTDDLVHDSGIQTFASTCNSGTNTSTSSAGGRVLYSRARTERKKTSTVFIDLRGFEQKQEEEKQSYQSVQRVLGLSSDTRDDESSSDEEERVERCDWRLTRQRIKQSLITHGASATLPTQHSTPTQRRAAVHTPPPRVINLQSHAISSRWPVNRSQTELFDEDVANMAVVSREAIEEEDNKVIIERQEAEREEERIKEEARKQRQERQKERETRLRMKKHLETANPQQSSLGKQKSGENTPVLFDLDASYEAAPTLLPCSLSPERETLLLTIRLNSNGDVIQHRTRSRKSVDTGDGISATYGVLLSWFLSLVPQDLSLLSNKDSSLQSSEDRPMFYVVGLQQMWFEEELVLCVVVTPSETFDKDAKRFRKNRRKDEARGSSKFLQYMNKFLTLNCLSSVCPWLAALVPVPILPNRPEAKDAPRYVYTPLHPNVSKKPLSIFVQVNSDPQAARRVFNIPVGFYWQTVDSDGAGIHETKWRTADPDEEDKQALPTSGFDVQNTLTLVYKKLFRDPTVMLAVFSRATQEGLDLAGVRLVYPHSTMLCLSRNGGTPDTTSTDLQNQIGPVLTLCLRGTFARTIWLDAMGPADPELARRTDPNSLCAQFGGETREGALLYCVRGPSRVQTELCRWFGGRISPKQTADLDAPVQKPEKKNRKGRKALRINDDFTSLAPPPPSSLTAVSQADILLLLSPLVPPSYLGVVLSQAQRRGYHLSGVRRLCLSSRQAQNLGISPHCYNIFSPGSRQDELEEDKPLYAIAPTTVLLLRKENALFCSASLIEAIMVQLTLSGLLGWVQKRLGERLFSRHLLHVTGYTDGVMRILGGDFTQCPEFDLCLSPSIDRTVRREQEQIAVVILLGHETLKRSGLTISKLLNVLPYSSKNQLQSVLTHNFELLGVKYSHKLTIHQAKEVTPCEVGDAGWHESVRTLANRPAIILALRGVDIFHGLFPLVQQLQINNNQKASNTTSKEENDVDNHSVLMSHNPSQSHLYLKLFFHSWDLYPDPHTRSLLRYLPDCRLYFNMTGHDSEQVQCLEDLDLTKEKIMEGATQQNVTSLLLVKHVAVKKYLSKLLRRIVQEQFQIVGLRMFVMDSCLAENFIEEKYKKDKETLDQHIAALSSDAVVAIVLCHENAVKKLLDVVGPADPLEARRSHQFTWRAEFGRDLVNNGLYCSHSYIQAVEDQKLLFPDGLCCRDSALLRSEKITAPAVDSMIMAGDVTRGIQRVSSDTGSQNDVHNVLLQTTCIVLTGPLMKANGGSRKVPGYDIFNVLSNSGFETINLRLVWLTKTQANKLLAILGGGDAQQVQVLCENPCLIAALQRDNGVLWFESIVSQTTEGQQAMVEYGDLILRPAGIEQANEMLTFFFDELMPGSHMTIC